MAVFYGLVFVYIRKKAFNFNGGRSGGADGPSQVSSNNEDLRKVARRMLFYPAFYGFLTLPMEIITMYTSEQWQLTPAPRPPADSLSIACAAFGNQVSHEVFVFAEAAISLLALSDVVIFLLTRKSLLVVRGQSSMILSSRAPEDQKVSQPKI